MSGRGDIFSHVKDLPGVIRTSIIVAAALIVGEVMFGAIVVSTGWGKPPGDITIAAVMAGLVLIELPAFYIIPPIATRKLMVQAQAHPKFAENPEAYVGAVYQTQMIIKFALVEGVVFANLVAFMIAHHQWSLGIVAGLMMSQVVAFPSKHKIETWVQDQLQAIRDQGEWSE